MQTLRPTLVVFVLLTVITGLLYPGLITLVAQTAFACQANGSVMERNGMPIGSSLLGQSFTEPRYFWPRPSSTGPQPNNGAASTGSNLATTSSALRKAVQDRIAALRAADPGNARPVPIDLVTASASGLDPGISPEAAEYQLARVARARNVEEIQVRRLVSAATEGRTFGVLGEPRVNVLELNLALDAQVK
jgi:K+-transporting ATPase ATPase C chain